MKTPILLALLVFPFACSATTNDPTTTDRYFAYPGATLGAKWKDGKAYSVVLSRTFLTPAPDSAHPESAFRSGCEFEKARDGIFWEFVQKTERGDVYLLKRGALGRKQTITPVLFTGEAQRLQSGKDLTIDFLPASPKTAK